MKISASGDQVRLSVASVGVCATHAAIVCWQTVPHGFTVSSCFVHRAQWKPLANCRTHSSLSCSSVVALVSKDEVNSSDRIISLKMINRLEPFLLLVAATRPVTFVLRGHYRSLSLSAPAPLTTFEPPHKAPKVFQICASLSLSPALTTHYWFHRRPDFTSLSPFLTSPSKQLLFYARIRCF